MRFPWRAASGAAWTVEDVRRLRELADQGMSPRIIATQLNRSESSIKNKAGMHGISLRPRLSSCGSDFSRTSCDASLIAIASD
jgi:hypothetical protein